MEWKSTLMFFFLFDQKDMRDWSKKDVKSCIFDCIILGMNCWILNTYLVLLEKHWFYFKRCFRFYQQMFSIPPCTVGWILLCKTKYNAYEYIHKYMQIYLHRYTCAQIHMCYQNKPLLKNPVTLRTHRRARFLFS